MLLMVMYISSRVRLMDTGNSHINPLMNCVRVPGSKVVKRRRIRLILHYGNKRKRVKSHGIHHGAKGGAVGTASARPWPKSIWAKRLIYMQAARIEHLHTMKMKSPSLKQGTSNRLPIAGCTMVILISKMKKCPNHWGTSY